MLKLNVVIPDIDGETLNINVACFTSPTFKVVFSRFQLRVIGPLAFAGFQFKVVRLSVSGPVPVFLM